MIEQKELINNIPAGKFHSVLMTSFSINLYYWDIQLMRGLSSKGIHFVSAIVDADCLSDHLLKFSKAFNSNKRLEFSLHGYKSKGAFHPKIQFYAGNDCILVLIGSGNLTISGHGKNMEVWTPIMVDRTENSAYPLVRDVWSYLSSLYKELGDEAYKIIKAIEMNCTLLQDDYSPSNKEHKIDSGHSMKLFVDGKKTLFEQCSEWLGKERINKITIMSPFYDRRAEFIKALYKRFNPNSINIIVENGFGSTPKPQSIPEYVNIYSWEQIKPKDTRLQEFFHAKCLFFKGEDNNYMICGSANASVAAFGIPGVQANNKEASVGYKSSITNYWEETGIRLINPINANDIKQSPALPENKRTIKTVIWIMEAAYEYDHYVVKVESETEMKESTITFYSGDRRKSEAFPFESKEGVCTTEKWPEKSFSPLYVEITDKDSNLISNRQFVIPTVSMDYNNPSPSSISFRKSCLAVESGQFVNGSVLKFIEQILSDTEVKISVKNMAISTSNTKPAEIFGGHYTSFEDYIKDDGTGITGNYKNRNYNSSNLQNSQVINSLISYIARSAKEKEEEDFEYEETENIKKSEGRENSSNVAQQTHKKADAINKRITQMMTKYIKQLEPISKENGKRSAINMLEALKKFMTAIFFINRIFGYRYVTQVDSDEEHTLIDIPYSISMHNSATEFMHRIINLFAIYVQNHNFKEETNKFIKAKIEDYKQYAFELCISALAICEWLNEGNKDYKDVVIPTIEATLKNIQFALKGQISQNSITEIYRRYDKSILSLEGFDKSQIEGIISNLITSLTTHNNEYPNGNLFYSEEFGFVTLLPLLTKNKQAIPCTMACKYDKGQKIHCPNYRFVYSHNRLYPCRPQEQH